MEQQKSLSTVTYLADKTSLGLDSNELAQRVRRRPTEQPTPIRRIYKPDIRGVELGHKSFTRPELASEASPVKPLEPINYEHPTFSPPQVNPESYIAPIQALSESQDNDYVEKVLENTSSQNAKPTKPWKLTATKFKSIAIQTIVVAAIMSIGIPTYSFFSQGPKKAQTVHATVETQLNFAIFTPQSTKFTVSKETMDYNNRSSEYSYAINRKDGLTIHVDQRTENDDNTKRYTGLVSDAVDTKSIITKNGVIKLVTTLKLKSNQVTTFALNGTRLFIRSDKPMPDSDWQDLVDSLTLTRY